MERKKVVLVDTFNNPLGEAEKLSAHKEPKLHRAFSVFLVNLKGEILIQKRADGKYHSGGLWANACCSHPESADENIKESAEKRTEEELGIQGVKLKELFSFVYFAKFRNNLFEYEHDTVFLGAYNGEIKLDEEEASEYKWISPNELNEDLTRHPEKYAVWFLSCAPRVISFVLHDAKQHEHRIS